MKGLLAFIKGESCQPSAVYSNGFIKEVQDSLSVIGIYMNKLIDSNSGIPCLLFRL